MALFPEDACPERDELRLALTSLAEDCAERGVELKEVASGYRFQVKQDLAPWVLRMSEERAPRYTRATLETLVLIAYRQPISRGEIEDIRGVAVSTQIIKTLEERNWIRVVGHRDVPGKPALFGTTKEFLDYFTLKSLSELPPLSEIRSFEAIAEEMEFDMPKMPSAEPEEGEGLAAEATAEPVAAPALEAEQQSTETEDAEQARTVH